MSIPHVDLLSGAPSGRSRGGHSPGVDIGARYRGSAICGFRVWAPLIENVAVNILPPGPRMIPLERDVRGYWTGSAPDLPPGTRYLYLLDQEKERPDPASRFQPEGVHGPSEIVDPDEFKWEDEAWKGIPLADFVVYEIHVGAFTPEGTFPAVISRLDYLIELGITALEIMPVAQFPGDRNWGYDGVYPFAPQNSYGGPGPLKALVNACHRKGIAVILDVVYNHLGPDGNYLRDFGPYFTGKYKTPWGEAVNFDGAYSDEVRKYFIDNALYWLAEYHMDGLRLDAIDQIYDFSARHFLAELAEAVHVLARDSGIKKILIAESDLNDARIIKPAGEGGYDLDAQWNDDFHHALHALLTGEDKGYYRDFGGIDHLEKAFREGFVYSGEYSRYRKKRHGNSSKNRPAQQLVVCCQNHDQTGNRMLGERLSQLVSFEQLKLAAACVILSPYVPLLFMGEEYGEKAPFQYFVSHIDRHLIAAIREGRAQEFAHFEWNGDVPDPQDDGAFFCAKINPDLRLSGSHKLLFEYYSGLLKLRRSVPALARLSKNDMEVAGFYNEQGIIVRRSCGDSEVIMLFSFDQRPRSLIAAVPEGFWNKILDSSSPAWGGPGERVQQTVDSRGEQTAFPMNPHSAILYERRREASR